MSLRFLGEDFFLRAIVMVERGLTDGRSEDVRGLYRPMAVVL